MALDPVPTYPGNYDATEANNSPAGTETRREGDDQIRRMKASEKSTWTNVTGAVTSSHSEINRLVGVSLTDPIITLPSGTIMLFEAPASAPTGWVKKTDAAYNDVAIRIVTGALTQGGTHAFSTLFSFLNEFASPGIVGHVLTLDEIPSHNHGGGDHGHNLQRSSAAGNTTFSASSYFGETTQLPSAENYMQTGAAGASKSGLVLGSGATITSQGGDQVHTHAFDNVLKYRDVYFAEKS